MSFVAASSAPEYQWELLQSGDGAVNFTTEMLEDEDVGIWRIYDFYAEKAGNVLVTMNYRNKDTVMYTVSFDLAVNDNGTIYGIVQCCGSVDYDSGTENCTLSYQDTLVDAAISTHENIVLNDYRHCADRLEHATDLGGSSDVDVLPDLRAGPHKCVRINH